MADRNSYLTYKRDTRYLIYWLIHTSNHIIKSLPSLPISDADADAGADSPLQVSKLIAKHIKSIPSTIYRLFRSVIAARTATHTLFQQIVAKNPDPEIERSNVSHKLFIDALTEAFEALGGETWTSSQQSKNDVSDQEDLDEIIFSNQFETLGLRISDNEEEEGEEEEEDEEEEEEEEAEGGPDTRPSDIPQARRRKRNIGKAKKGKGRKGKRRARAGGKPKPAIKETNIDEVPLESYRIIEDESGLVTDYLMAVYSLVMQWVGLRHIVQGLWRQVAYDGQNSAVAGSLSNTAVAIIRQSESEIFVEFPGHESYEVIMMTITRGDVEKAQGMFGLARVRIGNSGAIQTGLDTSVDIKEEFSVHAYWDLVDFITDFQKTRSGKPTKAMLATISRWDPDLDLQRASKEERIKWRRSYTINWLYDLVNVFSSIVVQRNTMKGENIVLESVDWSVTGPWNNRRRLFGLNEFAGVITSLAMQKPGTDVRKKILPNHVFQLQCIVDSLTVSRGWSLSCRKGHVLRPPAPKFRPRRDVDLFLDRENKRLGHGFARLFAS